MSNHGYVFLILSTLFGYLGVGVDLPTLWNSVAIGLTAFFALLFLISLVLGRKIKFDPILR